MKNANIHQEGAETVQKPHKPQKTRRFPKFGVLDAVIILLVIAIVVGIYFRYSFFDTLNSVKNIKECYVTFKTDKITTATSREMSEGDNVYFKSDGSAFGTLAVKSEEISIVIQEQPATATVFKDGKTHADVQYPQGIDNALIFGTGTIKCNCSVAENGSYLLNGTTYISLGQTYTVCTEKVTVNITITDIEVIS